MGKIVRIRRHGLVAMGVLGLVVILGLSACGTPAKGPSDSESLAPSEYTVTLEEDWPTYIDPSVGSDFSDMIAITNINDALAFLKNDGSVVPWLATGWEMAPDGMTWTVKLQKGVLFHNGEELTASDVVFTLKRMLTIGEGVAFLFTNIESATAVDDYTVDFKLKEPFGPFPYTLIRFYVVSEKEVMAHIKKPGPYGEFGDFAKDWMLTNDAGCGPYRAKEVKMQEYVLLEKFDDWWGGWEPNAPVLFKMFAQPDPATLRSLMTSKELQITDEWQAVETYNSLGEIEGVDIAEYQVGHNLTLQLNCAKAPTDDVHFRRALAYCFDYEMVVDEKSGVSPGSVPSIGPVPHTLPGWGSSLTGYTRDLEKAKAELAQSKYADDPGAVPVTYFYAAEVPWTEKIALLFQSNAAEIGINVKVTKTPFGAMSSAAQNKKSTPNVFSVILGPNYPEAGACLAGELSSETQGTWQNTHWMGTMWDAKLKEALSETDEAKRFELYGNLQQEVIDYCPTVWVLDQLERRAVATEYFSWLGFPETKLEQVGAAAGYPIYAHDMKIFPEKK